MSPSSLPGQGAPDHYVYADFGHAAEVGHVSVEMTDLSLSPLSSADAPGAPPHARASAGRLQVCDGSIAAESQQGRSPPTWNVPPPVIAHGTGDPDRPRRPPAWQQRLKGPQRLTGPQIELIDSTPPPAFQPARLPGPPPPQESPPSSPIY